MSGVSRGIDRIEVVFDDPNLVANAGLLVPATLMVRLGLERLVNEWVRLVGRVGGASPGRKVCTLVTAILAGASHIDHAKVLRAGATQAVLPFRVMTPSTLVQESLQDLPGHDEGFLAFAREIGASLPPRAPRGSA